MAKGGIRQVEIEGRGGLQVRLLNRGASIRSIRLPARLGGLQVALSYARLDQYRADGYFLGATIGRYAGRIRGGCFDLGGSTYRLPTETRFGGHCLHGGANGFHAQNWNVEAASNAGEARFRYVSADGEQGFPGTVEATVHYRVLNQARLLVEYVATTDRDTVVNLSNHTYFNLNGGQASIDEHVVAINADYYTPLDNSNIPTGEIAKVRGTRFDLRNGRRLGAAGRASKGYDHNFVLNKQPGQLGLAATVHSPLSRIRLRVFTTQPGLQIYTGDLLSHPFAPRSGLCLETQNFPDAPNRSTFPSAVLEPGQRYRHKTMLQFDQLP